MFDSALKTNCYKKTQQYTLSLSFQFCSEVSSSLKFYFLEASISVIFEIFEDLWYRPVVLLFVLLFKAIG